MDFIVLRKWEGVIGRSLVSLPQGAIIDADHYDVPVLKAAGLRVVAFSVALAALVAQDDDLPGDAVAATVVDADDNAAALLARVAAVSIPVFAGGAFGTTNGDFFITNGTAAQAGPPSSASEFTESMAGIVGTLTGISWNKTSAAVDMAVNVVVDGATVETITLTLGASGFLPLTAGTAITAQSRIAVSKASGTAPMNMTVKVFAGV